MATVLLSEFCDTFSGIDERGVGLVSVGVRFIPHRQSCGALVPRLGPCSSPCVPFNEPASTWASVLALLFTPRHATTTHTRNGPPTTRTHLARSEKQRATLTHSEFESRRRALGPPLRQSFALPDEAACMGAILRLSGGLVAGCSPSHTEAKRTKFRREPALPRALVLALLLLNPTTLQNEH